MDLKQYTEMAIMMQCCRSFVDQMRKCMENAGLIQQGFHLGIRIAPSEDCKVYCNIELEKSISETESEEYKSSRMEQCKFGNKEGWVVFNDPLSKKGDVPALVGNSSKVNVHERVEEETGHPYPPDNLWISSRDDYSAMVGGQ